MPSKSGRFPVRHLCLSAFLLASTSAGHVWAAETQHPTKARVHKGRSVHKVAGHRSVPANPPRVGVPVAPVAAPSGSTQAPAANDATGLNSGSRENILVTAERRNRMLVSSGGQLGALGNKKGIDVPFNIRSYNSSLILNQQAQTLGEVLLNDPSVRTTLGYGNFSQLFIIRGFPVDGDDVAINGLYGIVPRQLVSPQLYDQVQVLNGASAFLNGAAPAGSSIGGNINLMFKHAENAPLNRLTADYTSSGQGGGAVDIGRRFGQDKAYGFRLNAAGMDGETAINNEHRHDAAVGGDFDWHDDKTRITLDMAFQNQNVQGGRGGVLLSSTATGVPRPPSASHNYGQRWSYADLNYIFGMINIEHDFGKHITAYAAFGSLSGNEKGDYSTVTVSDPTTGAGTFGTMYVPYQQQNESTRAGIRAHFDTGSIHHEINVGGSGLWEEADTAYAMSLLNTPTNLYRTAQVAEPAETYVGGNIANPLKADWTKLWSLYFSDTLTFWHGRIALTAGFRYQDILQNSYDYYGNGGLLTGYNKDAFTPVVGFVVHPTKQTSIHFNRIEGLSPGPQATGTNIINLGQVFSPYQSVQYEVGAKYDIGRLAATIAFYQISQPNSYTEAVGNTGYNIFRVDGQQRNRGMELMLNGEIINGLRFNGGLTLINADLRRTGTASENGNTAIGVPNYTINANIEYDLPFLKGATIVGRVVNTGKQMVNVTNTQHLPGWTTFDIAARYTFLAGKTPVTARFGIDNIANKGYWSSAFNGYLMQGMPRVFKLSATVDF